MTKKHEIYTLSASIAGELVPFYVGHTNNPKRRLGEHRSAVKDPTNTEYKYQWCRALEASGYSWQMDILGEIEDDEDAEYEWVLRIARKNKEAGREFIDGLPLTNMKAGDFLHEILDRKDIRTKEHIKNYKAEKKAEAIEQQRAINYQRERAKFSKYPDWEDTSWNYEPTERGLQFKEYLKTLGDEYAAKTEAEKTRARERAKRQLAILNDTERDKRIEEETRRLMEEDGE